MKKTIKLLPFILLGISFTSCDKDEPDHQGPYDDNVTATIGFKDAPNDLFGNSAYGDNLYNGDISTGYIARIEGDTYAQFPINYGYNYNANFELAWCYTLYNGGFALSKYHDMQGDTYQNQLSVYDATSPSGGNFIVANGSSLKTDPSSAVFSDYDGCARVYITDAEGYKVDNVGQPGSPEGEDKEAWFKSVYINNTTYTYLTILNGNAFNKPLNSENKGWFKVQFIAFGDDDPDDKPLGSTEVYLANFNPDLAGGYEGIIDEWIQVDLSTLPECSVLVINFVGSDMGDYGLNTPAYCALDCFEISLK